MKNKFDLNSYSFTVRRLSADEGGGWLVEFPDIPGCMSDGETVEKAIANGREALRDTLAVFTESGRRIPKPAAGFYKSQCDPVEEIVLEPAFDWARGDENETFTNALTCSNCEQLKFFIGDRLIAEVEPDRKTYPHLKYAPFAANLHDGINKAWADLRIEGVGETGFGRRPFLHLREQRRKGPQGVDSAIGSHEPLANDERLSVVPRRLQERRLFRVDLRLRVSGRSRASEKRVNLRETMETRGEPRAKIECTRATRQYRDRLGRD